MSSQPPVTTNRVIVAAFDKTWLFKMSRVTLEEFRAVVMRGEVPLLAVNRRTKAVKEGVIPWDNMTISRSLFVCLGLCGGVLGGCWSEGKSRGANWVRPWRHQHHRCAKVLPCLPSINPQPLTSSLCVLVTSRLRPQTRSTRAVSVSGAGPPVVIPDTDAGLESLSAASVIHIVFGKPSERVSRSMRNILTFSKSEGVLVLVLVCVLLSLCFNCCYYCCYCVLWK